MPNENIVVLPLLTAKDQFKDKEYTKLDLWSYLTDSELDEATNIGGQILADHHSPHSGIDEAESLLYLGLSYMDSERFYGSANWKEKYSMYGRQAFTPVNTMRSIFREIQPSKLITTNSPRAERAAQTVAAEKGIPSVIFTDLFSGVPYYQMQATYINFLNSEAFKIINGFGLVEIEKVIPKFFGNPLLIRMFQEFKASSDGCLHTSGSSKVLHIDTHSYLDCNAKKSVFRSVDEMEAEIRLLQRLFNNQGLELIWRPHPAQLSDELLSRLQNRVTIDLTPLEKLDVRDYKFVTGRNSTALLELLLQGAKVIQIDPGTHLDMPLLTMGLATGRICTYKKLLEVYESDEYDSEQRLVKALNLDPQNLVNIRRFLQKDMAVGA